MTLVLNDEDVARLLSIKDCIQVLEEAYRDMGQGTAVNAPRRDSFMATSRPDAYYSFKTIEGGLERLGVMAQRINSDMITYPEIQGVVRRVKVPAAPGQRYVGLVFLYSSHTLELLAIITDGHLQRMRVAGTTGVAARYLAREDARTLALLGSGWQAETAAWALSAVRDLATIRVYSPHKEHRTAFAEKVGRTLDIEVVPVDSPEEAVQGADIVATATNAHGAVVSGAWVEEGMHLTCIQAMELEEEVWRRADLVVHSCPPEYYLSFQTANPALRGLRGDQEQEDVTLQRWKRYREKSYTLPQLLLGQAPARSHPSQVTLCHKSWGLGIEFASVGKLVYDRARAQGVGREVPTEWFTQTSHP